MKIACLQFAPRIGDINGNIRRAEEVITASGVRAGDLDLLALPELAFTGYNFASLEDITPHLEPTTAGISTQWARRTAQRLKCTVIVGYPEIATSSEPDVHGRRSEAHTKDDLPTLGRPVIPNTDPSFPHNYNSTVTISPTGDIIAQYRKSHLYYTDATWAREGSGFYSGHPFSSPTTNGQGPKTAMGVCMDLNSYNFTAPWTAWEFANHIVASEADLAVVNCAWLSSALVSEDVAGEEAMKPEMATLGYWIERLRPVVQGRKKVIVVLANRCGVEPGVQGLDGAAAAADVVYAGTSCVLQLGMGEVALWGVLGKGEEGLLVVDTEEEPRFRLKTKADDDMDDGQE